MQQLTRHNTEMYSIPYSRNIDVELNLAVGKINFVSPNFIISTFITCIKNFKCLHFIIEAYFGIAQILQHVPLQVLETNQFNKSAS